MRRWLNCGRLLDGACECSQVSWRMLDHEISDVEGIAEVFYWSASTRMFVEENTLFVLNNQWPSLRGTLIAVIDCPRGTKSVIPVTVMSSQYIQWHRSGRSMPRTHYIYSILHVAVLCYIIVPRHEPFLTWSRSSSSWILGPGTVIDTIIIHIIIYQSTI